MKITAIRNYEPSRTVSKINRSRNAMVSEPQTEPKSDSVAFKAHETAKGFGIGALLGLGAVTILSGGAAAPLVMAAYAATTGVAGGMLGKAVEDTNKKDNNDDENEPKE